MIIVRIPGNNGIVAGGDRRHSGSPQRQGMLYRAEVERVLAEAERLERAAHLRVRFWTLMDVALGFPAAVLAALSGAAGLSSPGARVPAALLALVAAGFAAGAGFLRSDVRRAENRRSRPGVGRGGSGSAMAPGQRGSDGWRSWGGSSPQPARVPDTGHCDPCRECRGRHAVVMLLRMADPAVIRSIPQSLMPRKDEDVDAEWTAARAPVPFRVGTVRRVRPRVLCTHFTQRRRPVPTWRRSHVWTESGMVSVSAGRLTPPQGQTCCARSGSTRLPEDPMANLTFNEAEQRQLRDAARTERQRSRPPPPRLAT